jgi:hypothetical protein
MDNDLDMENALIMEPLDGSFLDVSVDTKLGPRQRKRLSAVFVTKDTHPETILNVKSRFMATSFSSYAEHARFFYETKEGFDNHNERMYIRKLLCMECRKQFFTKSNLSSHLKLLH